MENISNKRLTNEELVKANIHNTFSGHYVSASDIEKAEELDAMEDKLSNNLEKGLIDKDLFDKAMDELDIVKAKRGLVGETRTRKDGSKWKKTSNGWEKVKEEKKEEKKEEEKKDSGPSMKSHSEMVEKYEGDLKYLEDKLKLEKNMEKHEKIKKDIYETKSMLEIAKKRQAEEEGKKDYENMTRGELQKLWEKGDKEAAKVIEKKFPTGEDKNVDKREDNKEKK